MPTICGPGTTCREGFGTAVFSAAWFPGDLSTIMMPFIICMKPVRISAEYADMFGGLELSPRSLPSLRSPSPVLGTPGPLEVCLVAPIPYPNLLDGPPQGSVVQQISGNSSAVSQRRQILAQANLYTHWTVENIEGFVK